ncbi:MAG: AAA family ATPase [Caldilineaceae bacterium]
MDPQTSFADWVRKRRQLLGLTQEDLARRVGCALITIKKIEQETRRPSREMAALLADRLAIPTVQRDAFVRLAAGEYIETSAAIAASITAPAPPVHSPPPDGSDANMPFVARERELAQLETHLVATLNGSGRIVFVTGEAGQGKTTLMAEFARRAQGRFTNLVVATGNCDAYAGMGDPYLPFRDVLALLSGDIDAGWRAGSLSSEQAHRLWALMPETIRTLVDQGPELLDVFVPLAALLQRARAVAPQQNDHWAQVVSRLEHHQNRAYAPQQSQLFAQYSLLLYALAVHHPLLLILDDLQWTDSASAGLLFHLGRRISGSRVLILGAYRPSEVPLEFPPDVDPGKAHSLTSIVLEFKRRHGDNEIPLAAATPEAGRHFVTALLDQEPNRLDERFRQLLFQRTQGHPLFTVELLREMRVQRNLIRDQNGSWIEGPGTNWELLPSRVEAVIGRRLGHLPLPLQDALKAASVEGETFTAEIVAGVQGVDPHALVRQLGSIADRQHGLIRGEGSERLDRQVLSRYRFRHILFQKYLYQTLDVAERIYLHQAVGQALEKVYGEQADDVAIQLAHHFEAAGLTAKAVDYLYRAGLRAAWRAAHHEAIGHFTQGIELLQRAPRLAESARQELRIQIALGISLAAMKGWSAPEAGRAYDRARQLFEETGDSSQLGSILWGQYVYNAVLGKLRTALALGEQCLRLAQEQDDSFLLVVGYFATGTPLFHLGELQPALAQWECGMAAYRPETHRSRISSYGLDYGVFSASYGAHALWLLGYPDQALARMNQALTLAQNAGHPYSIAVAQSYAAMLHQFRREWQPARTWAEATLQFPEAQGFPYYIAWATVMRGWAATEQEQVEAGIAQMEQGLSSMRAMESGLRECHYLALLAAAHAKIGRIELGLRCLDEAVAIVEEREERFTEAELYRLRGDLLLLHGQPDDQIEANYQHAIAIARSQQAKSLELRATLQLSRLWHRQGKTAIARQSLGAIYGSFTEGFDTPDLQEAKALLDG